MFLTTLMLAHSVSADAVFVLPDCQTIRPMQRGGWLGKEASSCVHIDDWHQRSHRGILVAHSVIPGPYATLQTARPSAAASDSPNRIWHVCADRIWSRMTVFRSRHRVSRCDYALAVAGLMLIVISSIASENAVWRALCDTCLR